MRRLLAFAICLLLPAAAARADGDGPTRKMTAAEAADFNALTSAFQAALPKTPANYARALSFGGDPGGFQLPESIRADQMARMSFTARYTLSREVSDGQQSAAYMDRARGTPEQQARLSALDAKDEQLRQAREATRDRGEKDRIRAEQKAVQKEASQLREQIMADYQAWVAGGGAAAAAQNAEQSLPAKELTVRALVNQEVNLNDKGVPYRIQGFPLAFELSEGCQDYGTVCITVLLGAFEKEKRVSGYTRYNLRNANLGVPTRPRGMAVVVAGPKEKAQSVRDFLGQVDLAKLKALLP
jgi:hypothetical protein